MSSPVQRAGSPSILAAIKGQRPGNLLFENCSMPQSFAQVWLHIVFSTKGRKPFLNDETFRTEMFRMLAHQVQVAHCVSASVGGHVDHIHLLAGLSRTITIAELIESIKTSTSKWAKKSSRGSKLFSWQAGYGAFSVSHSNMSAVDKYIRNQAEHHRKQTFQDEFRKICARHDIALDERYAWD